MHGPVTAFRSRLPRVRFDVGYLLAVVVAVPAALPLLSATYLQVHDGFAHLFRLVVLDSAMRQGVLLPRWSPELVFGLGYPIFNFYNPLVSYLAEIFHLLGLTYADSLRLLVGVGVLSAGALMYWYLRPAFGRGAALLGAVAYVYVPYHLLNIYVRGSFAEQLCYPLFPLALGLADRAFGDDGAFRVRPAIGLSLTVAALLLAHNPSVLYFSGILVLSVVWRWRPRSLQSTARWAGGLALVFGLAFGLTAFFWLPFLLELPDTWIGSFRGGVEDFYRSLQPPERLVQWSSSYNYDEVWDTFIAVGTVQAALALLGALALPFVPPAARRRAGFGVALALTIGLLMTVMSEPLWRTIPIASLMTFPWRLQAGMGLATALAAAAVPAAFGRWAYIPALPLGALAVWAGLSGLVPNPLALDDAMVSRASATRLDFSGALTGTTSPPQFVPRWVESPVQQFAVPTAEPATTGSARIIAAEVLAFDGWGYRLQLDVANPGPIRLRTFYFPGWAATVDGAPATVQPNGPAGEIALDLPAGRHDVAITFGTTAARRIGEATSLLVLVLLLAAGALTLRRLRLLARGGLAALILVLVLPPPLPAGALVRTDLSFGPSLRLLGWKPDYADFQAARGHSHRSPLANRRSGRCGLAHPAAVARPVRANRRRAGPSAGLRDCAIIALARYDRRRRQLRPPAARPPGRRQLPVGVEHPARSRPRRFAFDRAGATRQPERSPRGPSVTGCSAGQRRRLSFRWTGATAWVRPRWGRDRACAIGKRRRHHPRRSPLDGACADRQGLFDLPPPRRRPVPAGRPTGQLRRIRPSLHVDLGSRPAGARPV
ncbi:MAG: hypothetical protein U0556_01030 [Dehalococcoidia bacterium]